MNKVLNNEASHKLWQKLKIECIHLFLLNVILLCYHKYSKFYALSTSFLFSFLFEYRS